MKDVIRNWLIGQFGSDESLLDELYGQYAADMSARLSELVPAFNIGDARAVATIAHAMKGLALQMGDGDVAEDCRAIQAAGKAGDLKTCAGVMESLKAAVAAL